MHINAFPNIKLSSLFSPTRTKAPAFLPPGECTPFFNGRGALFHGLQLLNLQPGDTVLAPAYHCGVEIEALVRSGLRVLYYDVSMDMGLPDDFKQLLNNDEIKAVFVIHYWGFPQKINKISALCEQRKISLIEDCAHALFSRFHNLPLGVHGNICIYSLQKTLAVPDGGLLFNHTNNPLTASHHAPPFFLSILKATIRSILEGIASDGNLPLSSIIERLLGKKNQVKLASLKTYNIATPAEDFSNQGYDQSISVLAWRLFKKARPDQIVAKRRSNYLLLSKLLAPSGIKPFFPTLDEGVCPLFLPIYVEKRNDLELCLLDHGIETFVFGRTLHHSLAKTKSPFSQKFSRHLLGLPIHQNLQDKHIAYMAEIVGQCLGTTTENSCHHSPSFVT